MAFIGPRPLILSDVLEMPAWRAGRFEIRPGLTGLAQVSGGHALDPAEKLLLDLRYIDTRSRRLSLWILGRTCLCPVPTGSAASRAARHRHRRHSL